MSVVIDQEYEVVRIDGDHDPLREHPQNPNQGDEDVIDESIDVNGWYGAVTAQKSTGYIIAGNHRYRVAKKKGASHVPVIWRDIDDDTALRILLVDNQSARRAEMDQERLEMLLDGLDSLDGTGYGLEYAKEKLDTSPPPPVTENGGRPVGDDDDDDGPDLGNIPDADDIPDDAYRPEFGIILVCGSEKQQAAMYKWLQAHVEEGLESEDGVSIFEDVKMQVVAV